MLSKVTPGGEDTTLRGRIVFMDADRPDDRNIVIIIVSVRNLSVKCLSTAVNPTEITEVF